MNITLIFAWIWGAMVATSFWETSVEGRNAWEKNKLGWKVKLGKYYFPTAYHFWVFWIMWPLLLTLPLVIYGWNLELFGVLVSAYFSGMVIEDFMWYVVNPVVRLKEFWSSFSDYQPFFKVGGKKIIPVGYVLGFLIAAASWWFLWR